MGTRRRSLLACLAGLALAPAAGAEVRLAEVFSDNMVLQRGMRDPIWGSAGPGEKVAVSIAGQRKTAVAGRDGRWLVRLDPMAAGGPFRMTVAGRNTLRVRNILVGE